MSEPQNQSVASRRHAPWLEGALFLLTGLTITALNLVLYLIFIHALNISPPIAAALSFALMTPPHFLAYSKLVFRADARRGTVLRYAITILISLFLNVFVLNFFWAYLLADPLPAQLLGLIIAVLSNYLLLKFFVFRHPIQWGADGRAQIAINIGALILGVIAVYLAFLFISLLTAQELFNDDWRHYRDYFLDKSYFSALLDRQNGHPMIFPNIVMYHNFSLFGGQMSTLAIVNLALLGMAGGSVGFTLHKVATQHGFGVSTALAMFMLGLVLFYLLSAPNAQFWGLPLHNHAVIAATILSLLFVSGTLGSVDRPAIFMGWLLFTIIAAGSFSTGLVAALLGPVGAILNRAKLRTILLYAIIGGVIAYLSLGLTQQRAGDTDLSYLLDFGGLISFQLAFIGSPFLLISEPDTRQLAFDQSVWVGLIGVLLLVPVGLYALREWLKGPSVGTARNVVFAAFMLGLFVLALPPQIYIARMDTDGILVAIAPRFSTWASLYWYAIVWAYAVFALLIAGRYRLARWLPSLLVLSVALFAIGFNVKVVDERVRYQPSFHQDRITQIAINGAERPTRNDLWMPRSDIPQSVIAHLKATRRNLYAQDWAHRQGTQYDLSALDGLPPCRGMVRFRTTSRADEFTVEGWAFPSTAQSGTLHHLYVVGPDETVRGHARPTFGKAHKKGLYFESLPPKFRRLQSVPVTVLREMPGISGYATGNMRALDPLIPAPEARKDIELTGYTFVAHDAVDQACKVVDPRLIKD